MNIIATHATAMPSYGFGGNQMLVSILTVLVRGGANDCCAYQAVVPDTSLTETHHAERFKHHVASGGNKMSKEEAAKMFEFGDGEQKLEYRK